MLSSLNNPRILILFLYFIHFYGLLQFIGFDENYIKVIILVFACTILLAQLWKLKFRKHYLYLYGSVILIFLSARTLPDLFEYSPPLIILLICVHLSSLYERVDILYGKKIIRNLLLISFFGSVLKLAIFGIDESYLVGFMTMTAGEIGLLFPSFMLVLYLGHYRSGKEFWYIVIYLFLFGIINEKRSIVFIFPILFFILGEFKIRRMLLFVTLLYPLAISVIPSLNREEKVFGSIDLFYPFEYAYKYVMADYGSELQGSKEEAFVDKNVQLGRVTLLLNIQEEMLSMSLRKALFGAGLGRYTNKYSSRKGLEDNLFVDYGYRGNLSSFLQITLESGLLSFVFLCIFIYRHLKYYLNGKVLSAILFIYVYDLFFYGQTVIKVMPIALYMFVLIPIFYDRTRKESSTVYKSLE